MARAQLSLPATLAACLCVVGACLGSTPAAADASCAGANLTPSAGNLEQVRAAVSCLIDQERERRGEGALTLNASLVRAAQRHSREMVGEDFFSHVSPDGQTPLDRIRASGFIPSGQDGYVVGENIAWGTLWLATPQSIVRAWMESPGHRANILDAAYHETGVGVEPHAPASLAEGQAGALYTQDFGTIVPPGHSSRRAAAVTAHDERAHSPRRAHHRRKSHHRRRHRHRRRHHRRRHRRRHRPRHL